MLGCADVYDFMPMTAEISMGGVAPHEAGSPPVRQRLPRRLVVGGSTAFFLLGLLVASYGPLLPTVRDDFALSAAAAGLLLGAHAAGGVAGILLAGLSARRLPVRWRLRLAALLVVLGCTGAGLAGTWPLLMACAVVAGVGWGGFELDVNVLFASADGPRSAALLNLVGAAFGVGALLAPTLVALGGDRLVVLGASAVVAAATVPLLSAAPDAAPVRDGSRAWRLSGVQVLFVAVLLVYVGAETGVAGWMTTHLVEVAGTGVGGAAAATSGFWVAFTVGRLLAAPLSLRLPPPWLLAGTLLLAAGSLVLATWAPAAPLAYILTGLFLAPVFPTAFAWLAADHPVGYAGGALVLAGSSAGPVLISPLVGLAQDTAGAGAIPLALVTVVLLDIAGVVLLTSASRRRRP